MAFSRQLKVTGPTAGGSCIGPAPMTTTVNCPAVQTRANDALVMLRNGQLKALCRPSGTTHVMIDVNGCFR